MISLTNKLDLFLEMDMGTESKKQLIDKWVKYRLTLEALEAKGNDNKIVVLFILGNLPPDKIETRKQIVRYTIDQTLSHDFIDKFDIYIGTESELIAAVFEKIIPTHYRQYSFDKKIVDGVFKRKFKYQATPGSELKNCFYNASYAYYIRKVGPDKLIEVKNNKVQEFLYDDYIYQPLSVLNKIQFHKKHSSLFNAKHKREIDYIVLVQDLSIIKNDLEIINLLEAEGVYYTTPQRLVQLPFARAIVQFDNEGNVYHFKDSSLREKVLEN